MWAEHNPAARLGVLEVRPIRSAADHDRPAEGRSTHGLLRRDDPVEPGDHRAERRIRGHELHAASLGKGDVDHVVDRVIVSDKGFDIRSGDQQPMSRAAGSEAARPDPAADRLRVTADGRGGSSHLK